ncbi:MAG: glycosyltransferase [Methylobacter sp.]|nr:glycosyltransferase [Methylobacter sp.]
MKPTILTFAHYYLPGNLAGGPIRSIANMVDLLSDEFVFYIITAGHDYGASKPYHEIKLDKWHRVGKAHVFYASDAMLLLPRLARLIRETDHDFLYLNSFFDPAFTIQPLIARRLGLIPIKPLIIAPRGEFSEGAFVLKYKKKALYIWISKRFGLYSDVFWHASTPLEKIDIEQVFKKKYIASKPTIFIARDLLEQPNIKYQPYITPKLSTSLPPTKPLQLCFLSRISPMKNLDYALRVLADVKVVVCFSIYGPLENKAYWLKCQLLIAKLPKNIQVVYKGSVNHEHVVETLARHDLFFLPSLGENFGHAIHEALRAGIPVLLSDQTPWLNLEQKGVGWSLPLNAPSGFVQAIKHVAGWSLETRQNVSRKVLAYAVEAGNNTQAIEQNRLLFRAALSSQYLIQRKHT